MKVTLLVDQALYNNDYSAERVEHLLRHLEKNIDCDELTDGVIVTNDEAMIDNDLSVNKDQLLNTAHFSESEKSETVLIVADEIFHQALIAAGYVSIFIPLPGNIDNFARYNAMQFIQAARPVTCYVDIDDTLIDHDQSYETGELCFNQNVLDFCQIAQQFAELRILTARFTHEERLLKQLIKKCREKTLPVDAGGNFVLAINKRIDWIVEFFYCHEQIINQINTKLSTNEIAQIIDECESREFFLSAENIVRTLRENYNLHIAFDLNSYTSRVRKGEHIENKFSAENKSVILIDDNLDQLNSVRLLPSPYQSVCVQVYSQSSLATAMKSAKAQIVQHYDQLACQQKLARQYKDRASAATLAKLQLSSQYQLKRQESWPSDLAEKRICSAIG